MSFEGSATYYRLINEGIRARLGGSHSAKIFMYSVDFQEVVDMQNAARWADAGTYLGRYAKALEDAGADCVLMGCNTMYIVGDAVAAQLAVPFINIIDVTAERLLADGRRKPLLIGTRYTMEHGFYQERMARHGVTVSVPEEVDRATAHTIIYDELCRGRILDPSRAALMGMIEKAKTQDADSVIFGCAEIGLILNPKEMPLPGYDTTSIHAEAAVNFALAK